MAELCENISPGLLTDAAAGVITRSCRMTASPERKENRAFFTDTITTEGPDSGPDSPTPVWRLKLPNSLKRASWSEGEFGSCPAGRAWGKLPVAKLPAFCDYSPSFRIHDTYARDAGNQSTSFWN
jgi:hypothetical protein